MEKVEYQVAKYLLDIEAVKLSPDRPFVWASGWHSPIYCDNRKILSYPVFRKRICEYMAGAIDDNFPNADVIAGVATSAIAYGAIVAGMMEKPFVYVRPKPKDHGTGNQVEGVLKEGQNVVVIEDLISTGGSSLSAADALDRCGAHILGMVAIFSYRFPQAERAFDKSGVKLHTLSDYGVLIDAALKSGYIRQEDMEMLKKWRLSPETWDKNERD